MVPLPRLLRPLLFALLILMPVVAVLAFRSGDFMFSAMALVQALFAIYLLTFGLRPAGAGARIAGLALATMLIITGVGSLIS